MASITELLDKLKNARATVELVEACGKRVCSSEEHWNCPYGNEGMIDCAVLLEAAYEDTIENLPQLAEAIPTADVASVVRWIPVTERLPEVWRNDETSELVNYMIYSPDFGVDIGNYHAKAKKWLCMALPCTVTHWAPLPEPPEVGC